MDEEKDAKIESSLKNLEISDEFVSSMRQLVLGFKDFLKNNNIAIVDEEESLKNNDLEIIAEEEKK